LLLESGLPKRSAEAATTTMRVAWAAAGSARSSGASARLTAQPSLRDKNRKQAEDAARTIMMTVLVATARSLFLRGIIESRV